MFSGYGLIKNVLGHKFDSTVRYMTFVFLKIQTGTFHVTLMEVDSSHVKLESELARKHRVSNCTVTFATTNIKQTWLVIGFLT